MSADSSSAITYAEEPNLSAREFIDVLVRSTLAERRPTGDFNRIESMLHHADIIIAARSGGCLVGVARAITDFSFCCYLSDLAVDEAFQRQGIGREMMARIQTTAGPDSKMILLAAPQAASYYPHLGMVRHESCWISR